MKSVKFLGHDAVLGAPKGWNKKDSGECSDLAVLRYRLDDGSTVYASCWKPSFVDRIAILFGAGIWLHVISVGHPPVAIETGKYREIKE